jgi:hypothetical protein
MIGLNPSAAQQKKTITSRILKSMPAEIKNDLQKHLAETNISRKPTELRYDYLNLTYYVKIFIDEKQQASYVVGSLDKLSYSNYFIFSTLHHKKKIVSCGIFGKTFITLYYLKVLWKDLPNNF